MTDPITECDQCGADLWVGVPHECPVGGNTVIAQSAGKDGPMSQQIENNSSTVAPSANGWTCQNCGAFVPNGVTHTCTWRIGNSAPAAFSPPPVEVKLDRIIWLLERIHDDLTTLRLRKR